MKITTKTHPSIVKIAKHVYPDYNGRKFFLEYVSEIDTGDNANWSGGSKTYYRFVRLDNGNILEVPDFAPWKRPENEVVEIPLGAVCVTHTFFLGTDCGLTVYFPKQNETLGIPHVK